MKRITLLAASGALALTPVLGGWAAFGATDDHPARTATATQAAQPAQVRADDRNRGGEPEPGDDHGRHHRHHRHGADDGSHHHRHGADDGRHHHRHGGDDD